MTAFPEKDDVNRHELNSSGVYKVALLLGLVLLFFAALSFFLPDVAIFKLSPIREPLSVTHPSFPVLRFLHAVSSGTLILLMGTMLVFSAIDLRRKNPDHAPIPVSVMIPCYNAEATIGKAVESVFTSCDRQGLEVIVVNDASTDRSREVLERLGKRFPFRRVDNQRNLGKARSLNTISGMATNDIIIFLDADTQLNRAAVRDILARFAGNPALGAVSCPYRPANRGLLPLMQEIEYNMLLFTQGALNITSAMALWGGCLAVRRDVFEKVGGFSVNAITEDIDLAFKLNSIGMRVAQSFKPVRTVVPRTVRAWIRQKLRWTSGSIQCYVRHVPIWMKNPLQVFFMISYGLLTIVSIPVLFSTLSFTDHMWDAYHSFRQAYPVGVSLVRVYASFGGNLFGNLLRGGIFCLLPTVFVLPLVRKARDLFKLFLVFPFSLAYFPVFLVVSFFGFGIGLKRLNELNREDARAW